MNRKITFKIYNYDMSDLNKASKLGYIVNAALICKKIDVFLGNLNNKNLKFISKVYREFELLKLEGIICEKREGIKKEIGQFIKTRNLTYLEPALVEDYLGGRIWESIDIKDGGFMLNNRSWVTLDMWFSFMPYMIEFLLRSDRWIEDIYNCFIYSLVPEDKDERKFVCDEKFSLKAIECFVEFLQLLKERYEDSTEFNCLSDELHYAETWWSYIANYKKGTCNLDEVLNYKEDFILDARKKIENYLENNNRDS